MRQKDIGICTRSKHEHKVDLLRYKKKGLIGFLEIATRLWNDLPSGLRNLDLEQHLFRKGIKKYVMSSAEE